MIDWVIPCRPAGRAPSGPGRRGCGWTQYSTVTVLTIALLSASVVPAWAAPDQAAPPAAKSCGQPQTTVLTPDSDALVSSVGNANDALTIALRIRGITHWTALLSTANVDIASPADQGNAVVTFKAGLGLHLTANGAAGFNVFLTGTIIDDGVTYDLKGAYLGNFSC
ncbi:MAG TPA: hypothetical protein VHX39_06345 [Acetobacteraceae bacterium]|nr:hypothetical protein [Acetobacteraceae bacterium]